MSNGYINGKIDTTFWISQITAGIEFRKKYAHEESWENWRKYYRGNWRPDVLPSNIFFKMMRTIVPRIYFRNPSVSLVPTKPGLENMLFAQLLERIDNKLIKRMKIKKQMKSIVQDAFMFGTGIGKLGYGAEFTPSPEMLSNDQPFGKKGEVFEYNQNVHANMPWFMRVHPGSFIVPPGLLNFDDSRYAIHWIRRPLDDVKADPRMKHTASLQGGTKGVMSGSVKANKENQGYRNPTEMIDLYEVRDKKTQMVFVFAPYATDKILYQGPDDLQLFGRLPFYTVTFNEDDDVFWGVPDSKILEPMQLELNETRTMIMKHRRLSLIKILAKKGTMDDDQAAKLVDESVSPVAWINGEPLSDIRILEGNAIPRDLFTAFESTLMDVRETVGFSRNEFGEFNSRSGDTSATEASIVKAASEIRVDERRDMIADMLVDVVEHFHHIIFSHWNEEQVVDIMGPGGVPVWIRFKPSMLKHGAYEVKVDPDTSVPETKQARQQKAALIFQQLREDPLIDPYKLRKYFLTEMQGTELDDILKIPDGSPGSQMNPMQMKEAIELFKGEQQAAARGGK